MAALTLPTAGAVRVVGFQRMADEQGGVPRPTLSGQLRGDALWTARVWQADILCATDAEAADVYSDAGEAAISGDLTGALTAWLTITGDAYAPIESTWERVLTVRIREQP